MFAKTKKMTMKKAKKNLSKKSIKKAVETLMQSKKRAISPDADPLGWAKTICGQHAPTVAQSDAMVNVRNAAVVLIVSIIQNSKPSSDRTTAIRKVRESLMFASAAINLNWEDLG